MVQHACRNGYAICKNLCSSPTYDQYSFFCLQQAFFLNNLTTTLRSVLCASINQLKTIRSTCKASKQASLCLTTQLFTNNVCLTFNLATLLFPYCKVSAFISFHAFWSALVYATNYTQSNMIVYLQIRKLSIKELLRNYIQVCQRLESTKPA